MRRRILWIVFLALLAAPPALGQVYSDVVERARALYDEARYAESAQHYAQAFELDAGTSRDWYDAGCSWALAGNADQALQALQRAVELGYRDVDWLVADGDLVTLHEDPRWKAVVDACHDAREAYLGTINRELYELFQADQADRQGDTDWSVVGPRDEARRARTLEIVNAGRLTARDDFIHAAFIFQHGADSTSYRRANELAMRAVAIDSTSMRARWIAAATKDRYLMSVGRAQIYGTQYTRGADGLWTQAPYDTTAISDEERARWGVRSRAEQRARLRGMNP